MGGLIYVVIMAVWAVVLVPAWLRRHDHEDPSRSVDRFTRSMRLLASRPAVAHPRAERAPTSTSRPAAPEVRVVTRPQPQRRASSAPRARATAASRRRVVLLVLSGLLVAVAGLAAAGLVPILAVAAPVALIATFVGVARAQVRRAAAEAAQRRTATTRAAGPAQPPTRSASRYGIHADGTWDATTAPLPRYLAAPAASPVRRNIDTETPGAWTSAAMLERAQQERMRAERMEEAKREAIARARAEQAAAEARSRDEEFLAQEATMELRIVRRRAVNE